jgi:hypothetical protein
MVRPEGQTITDHDVAVATPPTDDDSDRRLDQSIAEELVARAALTASIWSGREVCWVI